MQICLLFCLLMELISNRTAEVIAVSRSLNQSSKLKSAQRSRLFSIWLRE